MARVFPFLSRRHGSAGPPPVGGGFFLPEVKRPPQGVGEGVLQFVTIGCTLLLDVCDIYVYNGLSFI